MDITEFEKINIGIDVFIVNDFKLSKATIKSKNLVNKSFVLGHQLNNSFYEIFNAFEFKNVFSNKYDAYQYMKLMLYEKLEDTEQEIHFASFEDNRPSKIGEIFYLGTFDNYTKNTVINIDRDSHNLHTVMAIDKNGRMFQTEVCNFLKKEIIENNLINKK